MSTRPSTQKQDKKIIRLWLKGILPKEIPRRLNLISINVVREAIRRYKRTLPDSHREMPKIAQTSDQEENSVKR